MNSAIVSSLITPGGRHYLPTLLISPRLFIFHRISLMTRANPRIAARENPALRLPPIVASAAPERNNDFLEAAPASNATSRAPRTTAAAVRSDQNRDTWHRRSAARRRPAPSSLAASLRRRATLELPQPSRVIRWRAESSEFLLEHLERPCQRPARVAAVRCGRIRRGRGEQSRGRHRGIAKSRMRLEGARCPQTNDTGCRL